MPDFGISLSGAAGPGGGGIAVPMGGGAAPAAAAAVHKEKVFGTAALFGVMWQAARKRDLAHRH